MQSDFMYVNHADEEPKTVGNMLGTAGLTFLNDLVNAKKSGQKLPGILDKIAGIAIGGQEKAIEVVQKEANEQANQKLGWIISIILVVILIIILIKNN